MSYTTEALDPAPRFTDWTRASKRASSTEAEQYWRALLKGASMTSILHHSKTPHQHVIGSRIHIPVTFVLV